MFTPYSFDPRIHNLGNIGIGGFIHAELAEFSTKLIDKLAYNGVDVRKNVLKEYPGKSIVDLCCGVGISTGAKSIGVDSSNQMINKARRLHKDKLFTVDNAESYKPVSNVDITTCMYAFHEIPKYGWYKIIENALSFTNEELIILDISLNYSPSDIMLTGEPYIENYLDNFQNVAYEYEFTSEVIIEDKVTKWVKKLI